MNRNRPVIIGREREIQQLEESLGKAQGGEPGLVLVSGEAGIGKTSLLDELLDIAARQGCLTVSGRASEFDQDTAFGIFIDALDDHLAALEPKAQESLAIDRQGAIAAVFPSLVTLGDQLEYPVTATERYRAHQATRELLERLAARRTLVLVLDDVQWADSASIELISYLLRHPPQAEVMIAMGYRTGHSSGSARLLREIHTSSAESVELGPLPLEVVTEMVGVGGEDIHRLSGGNPLYAMQLAQSGFSSTELERSFGLPVPSAVASMIEARLEGLAEGPRSLALAAAVAGDPFEVDVVAAALDRVEDEVLDDLDVLVVAAMIMTGDTPRRLQFRHPIVRSAIYRVTPPSALLRCHQRIATHLTNLGRPAGEVAFHLEQSAVRGDLGAIAMLRRAGEEAAASAPTSAIRWFNAALSLLPETESVQRAELSWALGQSLSVVGRPTEALSSLEQALSLMPLGDPDRVSVVVACAELESQLGHYEDARARLRRASKELPADRIRDETELLIALALNDFYGGHYSESLEWGSRAGQLAEQSADVALTAASLATMAMSAAIAGDVESALELHGRARELVDDLDDDLVAERLDALSSLAAAEVYLDRFDDAARHAERCMSLSRRYGDTAKLPVTAVVLGTAWWMIGDMERSAEVLDDAIESARLIDNPAGLSWVLFNRAYAAIEAGDVDAALSLSEESRSLVTQFDVGMISAYAGAVNAMTLIELGDAESALLRLLEEAGGETLTLMPGSWRPTFFELMTRCHLGLGDRDGAVKSARRARGEAGEYGLPLPQVMADLAEADIAFAGESWEEAITFSSAAARVAEAIGAKPYLARARMMSGTALARAGRMDEAIESLENSALLYEDMGATRYRDQAEAELRRLGQTVYRRSRSGQGVVGMAALTGREREVAELIADRRTNREIAEGLFLSTKTVETHIRNIFNKLGVASRVDVARAIDDETTPSLA
jgi:ATP/maltotriose-dependent transcriptional regulator MalT